MAIALQLRNIGNFLLSDEQSDVAAVRLLA